MYLIFQMQTTNPTSIDYLDGFAVHWYLDALAPPSFLDQTLETFPDKFIINSESCVGKII